MRVPAHHRTDAASWPTPYIHRGHAHPPRIAPVSIAAPAGRWVDQAACAGRWDEFDPSPAEETRAELNARVAAARRVCAGCPVMAECRTFARTARPPVVGVYAGRYYTPNTARAERNRPA